MQSFSCKLCLMQSFSCTLCLMQSLVSALRFSSCVPRERFDRRARGLQDTFAIWRCSPEQRPRVLVSEKQKSACVKGTCYSRVILPTELKEGIAIPKIHKLRRLDRATAIPELCIAVEALAN